MVNPNLRLLALLLHPGLTNRRASSYSWLLPPPTITRPYMG